MASTSRTVEDQAHNDQELLLLSNALSKHVDNIVSSVKELKDLRTKALQESRVEITEEGTEIDDAVIAEIDDLSVEHQLLQNDFQKLLRHHFIINRRGIITGLKLLRSAKFVLGMKIKIQRLKDKMEHLKGKLELLSAEIHRKKLENTSQPSLLSTEESSAYGRASNLEELKDWDQRLFAKKLRMIKYYYLKQNEIAEKRFSSSSSINSELQNKFGWLRSPKIDVNLDEDPEDDAEFQISDVNELKWQIRRFVKQRRREKADSRGKGKKSLLEYVILDDNAGEFTTLNLMHKKARELGDSLSRHLCDMFYVVLEKPESFHRFKDHLRFFVRYLDEKARTPVIRRVLKVLGDVEDELYFLRKFQLFPAFSDVPRKATRKQQETMDRIIDMFLKEFLRLESLLSYPSLSDEFISRTSIELKTFQNTLAECEKVIDEIGEEMQILKAIHVYVSEDDREGSIVKSFEDSRATLVARAWTDLRSSYVAN